MEDIYHYVPVAAELGRSRNAYVADLKTQVENSSAAVFHPDPTRWQGGWIFGYSGVTFDLDACGDFGISGMPAERVTNLKVNGSAVNTADGYDPAVKRCKSGVGGCTVAGYWFADEPTTINNCIPCRGRLIQVVTQDRQVLELVPGGPLPHSGKLMDVTEAVVNYLREGLGDTVTADSLPPPRITVKRLSTVNPYPFKIVQPLRGSTSETCPKS